MDSFEYRCVKGETDGIPFLIEVGFVWLGETLEPERRLVTGVNWSPGIVNPYRELGQNGEGLDSLLAKQKVDGEEPVVVVLHMVCPRVEYTDRGKSAVVISGVRKEG